MTDASQTDSQFKKVHIEVVGHNNVVAGRDIVINHNLAPASAENRPGLLTLISRVEQFWIKGVLDSSVHNRVLLELEKETELGAVQHPWGTMVDVPGNAEPIRTTAPIQEILERAGRLLLILGDPGAGKTTTLLELARDLLARAARDATAPVPVIFNLSSWGHSQTSLLDWLVGELADKYRINRQTAGKWLKENRLLPLLDGLDEIRTADRAACVKAINEFCATVGVPGLVVCSRCEEYQALSLQLHLDTAVRLLPLTASQIEGYLASCGDNLKSLLEAIRKDETLRALAQSPLLLSIMCLSYADADAGASHVDVLANQSEEAQRRNLFATYIEKMVERKGKRNYGYSREQITTWLTWLASRMHRSSQTMFSVDQLQPSWLDTEREQRAYLRLSRFCAAIVIHFAVAVLLVTLFVDGSIGYRLMLGSILGLISGLIASPPFIKQSTSKLPNIRKKRIEKPQEQDTSRLNRPLSLPTPLVAISRVPRAILTWNYYFIFLPFYLSLPVVVSFLAFHSIQLFPFSIGIPLFADIFAVLIGVPVGTFWALLLILAFELYYRKRTVENDIRFNRGLYWSSKRAWVGGAIGVIVSSAFLLFWMDNTGLRPDSDRWNRLMKVQLHVDNSYKSQQEWHSYNSSFTAWVKQTTVSNVIELENYAKQYRTGEQRLSQIEDKVRKQHDELRKEAVEQGILDSDEEKKFADASQFLWFSNSSLRWIESSSSNEAAPFLNELSFFPPEVVSIIKGKTAIPKNFSVEQRKAITDLRKTYQENMVKAVKEHHKQRENHLQYLANNSKRMDTNLQLCSRLRNVTEQERRILGSWPLIFAALVVLCTILSTICGGVVGNTNIVEKDVPVGLRPFVRNTILGGLFLGILSGLGSGILSGLGSGALQTWRTEDVSEAFWRGVITAVCVSIITSCWYGGLDILNHYILRFQLYRTGKVPWHFERFLNTATTLVLGQRVGAGFIFIHGLLLDYLASLAPASDPDLPPCK